MALKKPKVRNVTSKTAGIGNEAVQKATGKTWDQWNRLLDHAGAKKMTHKEIVACLVDEHGLGPWWRQMVTVGYEQARGLRQKHEMPDGYQISRSKTISAPVATLYRAWKDRSKRAKWLDGEGMTIRKATENKSLRITWTDARTTVEAMFYDKGTAKTQVTVQHSKLPDAKSAERMKAFWGDQLRRLGEHLGEKRALPTKPR